MLFAFFNTFLLIKNGTCVIQFIMNEFHLIKLNVLFLLSVNKDLTVAGMWTVEVWLGCRWRGLEVVEESFYLVSEVGGERCLLLVNIIYGCI
jgi:hypothetical protein